MTRITVNNGFRARIAFPFGWEGEVGVVRLSGGRVSLSYPSRLAPPVGHRMTLEDDLLEVRHVAPFNGQFTTLTLAKIGAELR